LCVYQQDQEDYIYKVKNRQEW